MGIRGIIVERVERGDSAMVAGVVLIETSCFDSRGFHLPGDHPRDRPVTAFAFTVYRGHSSIDEWEASIVGTWPKYWKPTITGIPTTESIVISTYSGSLHEYPKALLDRLWDELAKTLGMLYIENCQPIQ